MGARSHVLDSSIPSFLMFLFFFTLILYGGLLESISVIWKKKKSSITNLTWPSLLCCFSKIFLLIKNPSDIISHLLPVKINLK